MGLLCCIGEVAGADCFGAGAGVVPLGGGTGAVFGCGTGAIFGCGTGAIFGCGTGAIFGCGTGTVPFAGADDLVGDFLSLGGGEGQAFDAGSEAFNFGAGAGNFGCARSEDCGSVPIFPIGTDLPVLGAGEEGFGLAEEPCFVFEASEDARAESFLPAEAGGLELTFGLRT